MCSSDLSTTIHEDGSLGRGVSEVELVRDDTAGIGRVEASHDGYARRYGLIHERRLNLSSDGRQLGGEDRLISTGRRRRGEAIPFAVRFHLAPAIEVTTTADGMGAILRSRGVPPWNFRCRGGSLTIEDSLWIDGRGQPQRTSQLVIVGEISALGGEIGWQFRRTS